MSIAAVDADHDPLASAETVESLAVGVMAWTTTRMAGSFGLSSPEPAVDVHNRWQRLLHDLNALGITRVASATQIHGADIVRHREGWRGWLRIQGVDGHITDVPGTALVVTVADCTPVFLSHPRGVVAALHAGWRGTAARILDAGFDAMADLGCPPDECHVYLGPAICGACYEVGPEVFEAVYGTRSSAAGRLDVRSVLAEQAFRRGNRQITVSTLCTRCHNERFFSHRSGDGGRQIGIVALA